MPKFTLKIILIILCISGLRISAASTDMMVFWISIYNTSKSDVVSYFRYDMTVLEWQTFGDKLIAAVVEQKYKTDKFKLQKVWPGSCYIFYSDRRKDGKMRTLLASKDSVEKLKNDYERINNDEKSTIIEENCVPRGEPVRSSSHASVQTPSYNGVSSLMNNFGNSSIPKAKYTCPTGPGGEFEIVTFRDGVYFLRSDKGGFTKLDIRSSIKPYGNDEKVMLKLQNKLYESMKSVCNITDKQKRNMGQKLYDWVGKGLIKAIDDCRQKKNADHKDCKRLEKRMKYVKENASTGVRG